MRQKYMLSTPKLTILNNSYKNKKHIKPLKIFLKDIKNDDEGAIIIFYAVFIPLVILILAFAVEFSFAFGRKGGMQAAADAAAMSGAMQIAFDNPTTYASDSAEYNQVMSNAVQQAYATLNYSGFTTGSTDETRAISIPPPSVSRILNNFYVSTSIQELHFFNFVSAMSKLIGLNYTSSIIQVNAKAMAENAGDYCIIALNSSASGSLYGNGTFTLGTKNACGIAVNSNNNCALRTTGTSASILSPVTLVGGACATGNPPPLAVSYGYGVKDPYAINGTLANLNSYVQSASNLPSITGTTTLSGGVYVFQDVILKNNEKILASGPVTIIVAGRMNVDAQAEIDIKAMTTGPTAGIGIAYLGANDVYFRGGTSFAGALYAPKAKVINRGNPETACIQLIADTVEIRGNVTLNDKCPEISSPLARYSVRLTE